MKLIERLAMVVLICGLMAGCGSAVRGQMRTPAWRHDRALEALHTAKTDEERFHALRQAARPSFELGRLEEAGNYANELLVLLPRFSTIWDHDHAVQTAHSVLGRIALREGRLDDAKRHLLESANHGGSGPMSSFGPDMSLAKELIEEGERAAVLEYFGLCRRFWRMERGRLNQWAQDVSAGKLPDFGPNLGYGY